MKNSGVKILLTTLHARYSHSSLALPSLLANCAGLSGIKTVIREFTINEHYDTVLQRIAAEQAQVVAFSCYIWNIELTLKLVSDLKLISPETFIILGGPEVSFDSSELMSMHADIDCIVCGEGEATFRELANLLSDWQFPMQSAQLSAIPGICFRIGDEIVVTDGRTQPAELDILPSPFQAGLVDLAKPLVYYETARGCPFSCAFCISSIENGVRSYSMARIRQDLAILMEQRVQTVKFVDRTFNYDSSRANEIWEFILGNNRDSRFHFEIAADLLTEDNLDLLGRVPANCFNFEIGVQSTNIETLSQVSRNANLRKLFHNVEQLRRNTDVELHLDLVAGLPGEDIRGFLSSLQAIMEARPHHIQVELLKVLKGAPMRSIAREHAYAFSPSPPYRIHHTPWLNFNDVVMIETIARLIERIYNSSRFKSTLQVMASVIPLSEFFSKLAEHLGQSMQLPAQNAQLYQYIWDFISSLLPKEKTGILRDALRYDFCLAGYPAGSLPEFFTYPGTIKEPPREKISLPKIARILNLPASCRIRTMTCGFQHNFGTEPWEENPVKLTFAYWTATNQKTETAIINNSQLL